MNSIRFIAVTGLMLMVCTACSTLQEKPSITAEAQQPVVQPKTIEEACARPEYQCVTQPINVSLIRKDGSKYNQVLSAPTVIIQNGFISIFSGQTLYIEADINNDELVNLRLVPAIVHPEKTLTLKLEQTSLGSAGNNMVFTVQNPFSKPVKYHAGLMPLDAPEDAAYKTSTCPVIANISGFETWPEPIFQLVLSDFHMLEPDSKESGLCVF